MRPRRATGPDRSRTGRPCRRRGWLAARPVPPRRVRPRPLRRKRGVAMHGTWRAHAHARGVAGRRPRAARTPALSRRAQDRSLCGSGRRAGPDLAPTFAYGRNAGQRAPTRHAMCAECRLRARSSARDVMTDAHAGQRPPRAPPGSCVACPIGTNVSRAAYPGSAASLLRWFLQDGPVSRAPARNGSQTRSALRHGRRSPGPHRDACGAADVRRTNTAMSGRTAASTRYRSVACRMRGRHRTWAGATPPAARAGAASAVAPRCATATDPAPRAGGRRRTLRRAGRSTRPRPGRVVTQDDGGPT